MAPLRCRTTYEVGCLDVIYGYATSIPSAICGESRDTPTACTKVDHGSPDRVFESRKLKGVCGPPNYCQDSTVTCYTVARSLPFAA